MQPWWTNKAFENFIQAEALRAWTEREKAGTEWKKNDSENRDKDAEVRKDRSVAWGGQEGGLSQIAQRIQHEAT